LAGDIDKKVDTSCFFGSNLLVGLSPRHVGRCKLFF
jgi:hypothetical protein